MSDAPTLITVATGAIALGAGAMRLAQVALAKRNGNGKYDEHLAEHIREHLRLLLEARTAVLIKEIRDPIMEDLKETRHDLRNAMQTLAASIHLRDKL